MPRIGLCFTGQPYPMRQVIESAAWAEAHGYESVWIAEDNWTGRDAIVPLACIARETRSIRLGTSIIGITTRHPVLTALTMNALSELAPGRVAVGLGMATGWEPTGVNPGGRVPSPVETMRSTIALLRALFAGGTVPWGVATRGLDIPRPWMTARVPPISGGVPILIGATGHKMTRLAGEVADGLLLAMEALREDLPATLERLHEGARAAGRDSSRLEIVKLVLVSVTGKGPLDPNAVGWAAKSVALMDERAAARLGWDLERVRRIRAAWVASDWEAAKRLMTPGMVRAFVAAGTREHCLEVLRETARLGVTTPVIIPYGGELAPVLELGAEYARG